MKEKLSEGMRFLVLGPTHHCVQGTDACHAERADDVNARTPDCTVAFA